MREPFPTTTASHHDRHELVRRREAPRRSPRASVAAVFAIGAAVFGCGSADVAPPADTAPDSRGSALVDDGVDVGDLETRAASVGAIATFAALNFEDAAQAAAATSRGTKNFFVPAGCVTSTVTGEATVVHVFDQCNGPWGLRRITGTVTITIAASSLEGVPALALEISTEGLGIALAKVDFHARAVLAGKSAERRMTYAAELEGTTGRGRTFSRRVDWREAWKVGESCLTIDGVSEGTVGARSLRTTAENFQRCRNACPTAGGGLTLEDTDTGETVSIRFDGESGATVTGSNGRSYALTLPCAAE